MTSSLSEGHVVTGPTRAAYDHGMTEGPCVSWRIDHMLYTTRTLQLDGAWQALEGDPEAAAAGLPCRSAPSDHLPIAARFTVGGAAVLPAADAARVEAELLATETRHADGLNALKAAQLVEMTALDAKEAATAAAVAAAQPGDAAGHTAAAAVASDSSSECGQPKKKQKKKKKQHKEASEEFKALKRMHREAEKVTKGLHLRERTAWISGKEGIEREHVVWVLLPDPNCWVESGRR